MADKSADNRLELEERSADNEADFDYVQNAQQKRQVGVVYRDEKPIGILQVNI